MRWFTVSVIGVVLVFGVSVARGQTISPELFTAPVPVPMDPPWEYHGTYDPAKPTVTADGQWLSFKQYLPFKVYTAEWTWIEFEGQWQWGFGNVIEFPEQAQTWCGGSHIYVDPDTHQRKWLFYEGSEGADADIYRSSWLGDHWGEAVPIPAVNDPFEHADQPYFDESRSRLYFHAHADPDHNNIYYSHYDPDTDTFGTPQPIDPIDDDQGVNVAGYTDVTPSVSPDGQTLFWDSNRPGGEGGFDIWMSNWESDSWGVPVNLGPTINTAGDDHHPTFNGARYSLYFMNSDYMLVESKLIPEPSTFVMLSMGAVALAVGWWRRRKA